MNNLWVTIRVEYEGEINTSSVAMVSVKSVNTERLCPDCLKQQILASLLAKGDLAVIVEDDECRYHRTGDRRHGKVNELEQLTGSPNYFEKSGRGRDSNRNGRHEGIMSDFDPTTKSIDPTNDLPVLLVRVSDDGGQLVGWCPFCRFNHYHGTFGDPTGRDGEGHRVAHCIDKSSPFENTGYILKLDTDWEKIKKAIKGPGVKPTLACDHTEVLDILNDGLDRLAEVNSRFELGARILYHGGNK